MAWLELMPSIQLASWVRCPRWFCSSWLFQIIQTSSLSRSPVIVSACCMTWRDASPSTQSLKRRQSSSFSALWSAVSTPRTSHTLSLTMEEQSDTPILWSRSTIPSSSIWSPRRSSAISSSPLAWWLWSTTEETPAVLVQLSLVIGNYFSDGSISLNLWPTYLWQYVVWRVHPSHLSSLP